MEIREKEPTVLEQASLQYNDWRGNAVAENGAVNVADIYELAGLNNEEWMIVAFDLSTHRQTDGRHAARETWDIHVYALNRSRYGFREYGDYERIANEHGGLPVVDVLIHDATVEDLANCFKSFSAQFRLRSLDGIDLLHSAYADHPEQD